MFLSYLYPGMVGDVLWCCAVLEHYVATDVKDGRRLVPSRPGLHDFQGLFGYEVGVNTAGSITQ